MSRIGRDFIDSSRQSQENCPSPKAVILPMTRHDCRFAYMFPTAAAMVTTMAHFDIWRGMVERMVALIHVKSYIAVQHGAALESVVGRRGRTGGERSRCTAIAEGKRMVIPLTRMDGALVDVERIAIRDIQPLGDGCVIYMLGGPPVRVMQSMAWVMALWKSDSNRRATSEIS